MIISIIIFTVIILTTICKITEPIKNKNFGLFDYFLIWFTFIYALVPLLIIGSNDYVFMSFIGLDKQNKTELQYIPESLIILVSYLCIILGGKIKQTYWSIKQINISDRSLFQYSILFFILSIFFFFFFISKYGGFDYVIANLSRIRSGVDENKSYLGAFMLILSDIIVVSFIICLYLKFKGFFRGKVIASLFFYIILASVFFKFFIGAGRANIVLLFIYITLSYYFIKTKIPYRFLFIGIPISLFVIFYGKVFLFNIFSESNSIAFVDARNNQESYSYFSMFIHEFNHQFFSMSNFLENNYESRYMKDYWVWLLKPLKLFDKSNTFYDSISYYNTYLINRKWDSEIPPGFIGLSYINGSLIALTIQSLLWGKLTKWLDLLFKNSDFKNKGILFVIYILIFNYGWFIFQNGDPALIIQYGLIYILLFSYLIIRKKIILVKVFEN